MKIECLHADTCLPSYWGGHHLPHVQIPVWRGMHLSEVRKAIFNELAEGAVMGSCDDARLLAADMVSAEEVKRSDQLTRAAYAAVKRMRPAKKGARRLFNDLEETPENDDYCESVYAFFVFVVSED